MFTKPAGRRNKVQFIKSTIHKMGKTLIYDVCEQRGAGSIDFAYSRILQTVPIGQSGPRRVRRVLLPPLDLPARNTCNKAPRPADGV
jgi:hypothetical protein